MRILGCGLIAVAALLGVAPTALAGEPIAESAAAPAGSPAEVLPSTSSVSQAAAQRQEEPHAEVSLLAVWLTAGAAAATAGSGAVHAVNRRRALQRSSGRASQDTVRL